MKPELKPCPFCGMTPVLEKAGLNLKFSITHENPYCIMPVKTRGLSKYRAIRMWNNRVPCNDCGSPERDSKPNATMSEIIDGKAALELARKGKL